MVRKLKPWQKVLGVRNYGTETKNYGRKTSKEHQDKKQETTVDTMVHW